MSQTIDRQFDAAQQHHATGNLRAAEQGYRAILQDDPAHVPSLHFLGVLAMSAGDTGAAVDLIGRAIAAAPDYADAHSNLGNAFQMQGKSIDAIASYRKAIAIDPDYAVAHMNLGTTLLQQGNARDAAENLRNATVLDPDYVAAHRNLGAALRALGDLAGAVTAYEKVAALQPNDADALNDLGVLLEQQGRLGDAVARYERAIELRPDQAGTHLNLGRALEARGEPEAALAGYQKAIDLNPDYAVAFYSAGNVLAKLNRSDAAAAAYRRALEIDPDDRDARLAHDALLTRQVPFWHFPMMNDGARNDAFEGALKAAIGPDSVVLDIGSGSGLLALMAARAGAARVDTAEVVPAIADAARQIVEDNGYGDTISVHNKLSTALQVGEDLPAKANLLVTETFDVGVLGEHVVKTVHHARANLLAEDAVIIPQRADVVAALVDSPEIYKLGKVQDVSGFDLSAFNRFKKPYHQLSLGNYPYRLVSAEFPVFSFDFTGDAINPASVDLAVPVTETGACHGIAFWFRLILDENHAYDTGADRNPGNHWEQAVQLFDAPLDVAAGSDVALTANHNNKMIWFSIAAD